MTAGPCVHSPTTRCMPRRTSDAFSERLGRSCKGLIMSQREPLAGYPCLDRPSSDESKRAVDDRTDILQSLCVSFVVAKSRVTAQAEGSSDIYRLCGRLTLRKPSASARSLKHCLQMLRPYFRIRPAWWEHTRLREIAVSFICSITAKHQLTSLGCLCRRFAGASTTLIDDWKAGRIVSRGHVESGDGYARHIVVGCLSPEPLAHLGDRGRFDRIKV
ncbi:uncharacterized protein L969DRAFT_51370 [Mixia osmundae IAM 14324]|uniref:Uncharacterized protein n=1 Tax=Mixia osmundae (strain CBS 9802 / IAM 14324 / JCM 22182 / KY 12970) TaxID=764103 RepID=G7EAN1_MIXOS|nr:uncharacterized protein L969DRAFT_51370 [Mixia osmundae IAM 14324]KEI38208.1 hypothetical protein L969DRAFT_51370 [Mixia osmundae IAM 14324]GAA99891.1 hypothetical protein E5Q_06594 [Mixia osmundae IAM 14324]